MKKERESGIELLRIVLMIQVIFLHISAHGGYADAVMELGPRHYAVWTYIWMLCRGPMFTYFMLFGYFSAERQNPLELVFKRALGMRNTMCFYGIAILLICIFLENIQFHYTDVLRGIFPIVTNRWYFMTDYVLILLLTPFLSKMLGALNNREYTWLIVLLFAGISIWRQFAAMPCMDQFVNVKFVMHEGSKNLLTFGFAYILGGYIKRMVPKKGHIQPLWLVLYLVLGAINAILYLKVPDLAEIAGRSDNPLVIVQCISLLLFAREFYFRSKAINVIASANLGVYLIHDDYLGRELLWRRLPFRDPAFYDMGNQYIVYVLGACVMIYVCCAAIDLLRQQLFAGIGYLGGKCLPYRKRG